MLNIEKVSVKEVRIEKTQQLNDIVKMMKEYGGIDDAYSLLPTRPHHVVTFQLNNTDSAFANAIRRIFVEEITVASMTISEGDIITDDEFIAGMKRVLIKNLALTPIDQDNKLLSTGVELHLNVRNTTNDIIDVYASDIKISGNKTNDLIIYPNIVIMRLRPGRQLNLRKITIQTGRAYEHYGYFSLLNATKYKPLDITPYDQFTKKGEKSMEVNCSKFEMGFTTCGNISPKSVINKMIDKFEYDLSDIKSKVIAYSNAEAGDFYSGDNCEVEIKSDIYNYKFPGHYISVVGAIAMRCYRLDENILFCTSRVDRFDSMIGYIRLKHADPNKLLISAIDSCLADLEIISKAFAKL
jgi:hypothetical protein